MHRFLWVSSGTFCRKSCWKHGSCWRGCAVTNARAIETINIHRSFVVALVLISMVGVGSVAFHMTLKHHMQMLDEVPMLWDALSTFYIVLENEYAKPRYSWLFPAGLIAYGLAVSLLVALTEGQLQFFCFHISFGSLELYCLYRVFQLRGEHFPANSKDPDVLSAREVSNVAFATYLVALMAWQLDINFCPFLSNLPFGIPNPQLHSWWHILVSIGLYELVVLVIFRRQQVLFTAKTLPRKPSVHWFCGVIPYISLQDDLHVR